MVSPELNSYVWCPRNSSPELQKWSPAVFSDLDSELIVAMEEYSQYVSLLLASRFAIDVEIHFSLLVLGDHTPLHCVFVNKMK